MKRPVDIVDILKKEIADFITQCSKVEIKQNFENQRPEHPATKWGRANREKLRESQKKYESTEKGRLARLAVSGTRMRRYRDAVKDLTPQEMKDIKEFYRNRPPGYHVDHIVPLSKGGEHHRSNLQYLTAQENLKKNNNIGSEALHAYRQRKKEMQEFAQMKEKSASRRTRPLLLASDK